MKKTIWILILLILCLAVLASCGRKEVPLPGEEAAAESKTVEDKTPEEKPEDIPEPEKPEETVKKNLEPGIEGPKGWPEDVPTPLTGEFLWGDWMGDEFYTVDIRYMQDEIDAYAERLQDAGFKKIDTDKYEDIYGDAGVYANDKWEIVVGDEGVNGDYTYMSFYPVE